MTGPEWNGDLDAWVRAVVAWHLHPETGSPYWLSRAKSLGFDPLREVRGFADLLRFPAVAREWRRIPAADLIPRGCRAEGPFNVWESGGTTGPPQRIVDSRQRSQGLERVHRMLGAHGFPGAGSGDWLHLGPTGPHLVGRNVGRLAARRGALCHYVDLDPRWVKRLQAEGRVPEARRYIQHVVEQALAVLATQPVAVLATTPPLLLALAEHAAGEALLRAKVRGLIWFGTSASAETLRLIEEEILPGVVVVGWYGNTLMGIACQRPRRPGDPHRAIFQPPYPEAVVRVVDPANPAREVEYGKAGQVVVSLLNRELFLPHHAERDQAVRELPAPPEYPTDGLAEVRPLPEPGGALPVEGVY